MLAVRVLVLTVFSVVVCAGSSNLQLTGDDVETWTLTCNSSSIPGPSETTDFIQSVQLNADSDHFWLVKLTCDHSGVPEPPKENESFFNYTTLPVTYFTRGYNSGACASAFLQLFTVGHPHCSSQSPRLGSVESRLRNLHYQCAFTFTSHDISSENYSTAEFEARNYTKLICCVGDGCGTDGGNGTNNRVPKDYKYLQMVISHIRNNNDKIERCRVISGVDKNTDGNVFSEGRLNDTGARLECHVPRELDCAEFQCQVVTSKSEMLIQTLKHSKFNENQYCRKGDSLDDSAKQERVPIAVSVAVPLTLVAAIAVIGVLVCRYRRNGSNTVPGSPKNPDTNTTEEHPLNANNADNDNGHDTC